MALAYGLENTFPRSQRVLGFRIRQVPSPLTAERALRALIDFTLSKARRFYSSMGNPLDGKGLECFPLTSFRSVPSITLACCYPGAEFICMS